jgi:hypothetical protein
LDSETLSVVIEQINVSFFFSHISFQCHIDHLDVHLVPAPQYIADRRFENCKIISSEIPVGVIAGVNRRRFFRSLVKGENLYKWAEKVILLLGTL